MVRYRVIDDIQPDRPGHESEEEIRLDTRAHDQPQSQSLSGCVQKAKHVGIYLQQEFHNLNPNTYRLHRTRIILRRC